MPDAEYVDKTVKTALSKKEYDYEIAFFGGSFTAIDRDYMLELLSAAYPYVKSGEVSGIRISTRPDCITEEILDLLKNTALPALSWAPRVWTMKCLKLTEEVTPLRMF